MSPDDPATPTGHVAPAGLPSTMRALVAASLGIMGYPLAGPLSSLLLDAISPAAYLNIGSQILIGSVWSLLLGLAALRLARMQRRFVTHPGRTWILAMAAAGASASAGLVGIIMLTALGCLPEIAACTIGD